MDLIQIIEQVSSGVILVHPAPPLLSLDFRKGNTSLPVTRDYMVKAGRALALKDKDFTHFSDRSLAQMVDQIDLCNQAVKGISLGHDGDFIFFKQMQNAVNTG